jgi:hypothetical protein
MYDKTSPGKHIRQLTDHPLRTAAITPYAVKIKSN